MIYDVVHPSDHRPKDHHELLTQKTSIIFLIKFHKKIRSARIIPYNIPSSFRLHCNTHLFFKPTNPITLITNLLPEIAMESLNDVQNQQMSAIDATDDLASAWEDALSSVSEQSSFKQQAMVWYVHSINIEHGTIGTSTIFRTVCLVSILV